VTWRWGVGVDGKHHDDGMTVDLPTGIALSLETAGRVRLMPWLAPRPRRKGEVIHEPGDVDPPARPVWLLDDLLDVLPALTVAPRSPRLPRYTTTPAGHAPPSRHRSRPRRAAARCPR
jgi:hypothetical protein